MAFDAILHQDRGDLFVKESILGGFALTITQTAKHCCKQEYYRKSDDDKFQASNPFTTWP